MKIPTGHMTITSAENRRMRGILFRGAREGDVYVCQTGNHWVCHGKQMGDGAIAMSAAFAVAGGTSKWKQERGIPAGVDVKYETSYTKRVVDALFKTTVPIGESNLALKAAMDLLVDYHSSLHAPYEQRDKARQYLVVAEAQRDQARKELQTLKERFQRRCNYLAGRLTRYAKGE